MARFNTKSTGTPVVSNEAGGTAYKKDAKLELVSLVVTSFVNDQYYRSGKQQLEDLARLVDETGPEFAAKAAIYARTKFHMRSITHALAAIVAPAAAGKTWARNFFANVVERPDDITEILSFWFKNRKNPKGGKAKLTMALKNGLARAFAKFDGYQLAKYRGEKLDVSLIDAVRLLHPRPTEKNAAALKSLVEGTLKSTETWESKLSSAGQKATAEEKVTAKAEAWTELLRTNKLGYFALLRNLRNISTQAPEALPLALQQLTDPDKIRRSKVLPFRFATAMDEVGSISTQVASAINRACEISLQNVPELPGRTLIAVDHSGSMNGKPLSIAALFGAVLALRAQNPTLMVFEQTSRKLPVVAGTPLTVLRDQIMKSSQGGGTDFSLIFEGKTAYDRIIILSDMQPWVANVWPSYYGASGDTTRKQLMEYRARSGATPDVFSFDLAGSSTTQFLPSDNVFHLAGFSEQVFEVMKKLSGDRSAMVQEVEDIDL